MTDEASPSARVAGWDLIRALAVAMVIGTHTFRDDYQAGGIVGVVLFFSLSGYLITDLVMRDVDTFGRLRWWRFYANRFWRLMPPLVLMMAGLALVTATLDPHGEREGLGRGLLVGLTYTADLPIDRGLRAIAHLWTLAVEEQFYLAWPLVIALGAWIRRPRLVVALTVLGIFVITVLTTAILVEAPGYALPTSWAATIAIGAAGRVWRESLLKIVPTSPRVRVSLFLAVVAGLVSAGTVENLHRKAETYVVGGPAVAAAAVALVLLSREWIAIPSALAPAVALGRISYAVYLWNWPISLWLGGDRALEPTTAVLAIGLTLLAATSSWWLLERPIRRSRLHRRHRRPDVATVA